MSPSPRVAEKSILLLLTINILVGLLTFRSYGYAWDEPLFYDYGEALGYAYSPREWISGSFDLERSYGSSGDDHKTRGPAYLLLASTPASLLESLGLDKASAWHLINFLFFQIGVYFLFRLALRWMRPSAALAASALFSWQPLLWGHAFINPKDPPFLVFFLTSVCLGFEMVDRLLAQAATDKPRVSSVLIPGIFLGITTSIRVLGPLAGLLVFFYFIAELLDNKRLRVGARAPARTPGRGERSRSMSPWFAFASYAVVAVLTMFVTWPFLWEDPLTNFAGVFQLMSDNPTNLSVLFGGEVYRAGELPRRYLPFMLVTTLTEPVWPLFLLGLFVAYLQFFRQLKGLGEGSLQADSVDEWRSFRSSLDLAAIRKSVVSLTIILLWFFILLAYVLLRRPAMYDGMRHFLFILPPIFLFTGFAFQWLIEHIAPYWLRAVVIFLLLAPGILGLARLHPYEYTYYNSFVGGTSGVFRQYETDYWLTCYKEAVETLEQQLNAPAALYVHREAYIAGYYRKQYLTIYDLRGSAQKVQPGEYVLVNTRTNEDRRVFKDAPLVLQIGRGDAIFCEVKQIP